VTGQSREEFKARLHQIGAERYHDKHPFHHLLHSGSCTIDQVRAWVINRYYYQSRIPMKDAAFLSRVDDHRLRRIWRHRIEDHDGTVQGTGGIERWLKLAVGVGLDPEYVRSAIGVLPATRFAVDAYVRFVRAEALLPAVASSLTELFAPKIHKDRIAGLLKNYSFANEETISYFQHRLSEAPRDVAFGLEWVLDHAISSAEQDAAAAALVFKTEVLWSQLDALYSAYVAPARVPPGAWQPHEGLL
jgi:pyrroloquinoline-quinone synthase|tara:strand:+ start:367 stop:1104 length:738 start_codon:yes stop_codon:yes gene_type:complete